MPKKTNPLSGEILSPSRLNNAQRRALAEIVDKRLNTKINAAAASEEELKEQIVWKLAKRFKVDTIQNQITKLEKDIESLKRARNDLGFESWGDQLRITSGQAAKLLEAEVAEHSVVVGKLEDTRDVLKQKIWLAQTVTEAREAVQQIEGL